MAEKTATAAILREIKRRTRKRYSSEEKIRILLEGLRWGLVKLPSPDLTRDAEIKRRFAHEASHILSLPCYSSL